MRTWNKNVIYRDRSHIVELLQLENKQQIMQSNVETQHNGMYSLYIGSVCRLPNGTLYLHRDHRCSWKSECDEA